MAKKKRGGERKEWSLGVMTTSELLDLVRDQCFPSINLLYPLSLV